MKKRLKSFLDGLGRPKKKLEIERQIKELNKRKAELKAEEKELEEVERDTEDVRNQINEIDKEIKNKYDELATIEYKEAMKELGEEDKEKKMSLTRLKAEFKEVKKEKERLKQKLKNAEEEINQLKQGKKDLAKKINEMQEGLRDKEMQIEQKKGIIEEMKQEEKNKETQTEETQIEDLSSRVKMLEYVLNKYSDYIEEKEKKTIQEMKELIQPDNISLREFLSGVEEEDTLKACEQSYNKIMREIESCEPLPIEHWMNIKSMIDEKITDYEDRAILLCSTFRHLGAKAYIVMTTLEDNERIPIIQLNINEKYLFINPNAKHQFRKYYGTLEELKEQFEHKGKKIKKFNYMYNDREYRTFEE